MRVLLVGAGAVGQVFGWHLQQGGAEIAYRVKPKYAEETRRGFALYPLNRRRPREAPVRFEGFDVLTDLEQVAGDRFDQVWLCTGSHALRAGDWVERLGEATGDATFVGLQPGLGDADYVRERVGADRVVWGLIEFIAYAGPLEGEDLPEPGTVFWLAPIVPFPFSGPDGRVRPVIEAAQAGGLRARQVDDVATTTALGSPLLNLHMVALECAGWRFAALRRDPDLLPLASDAVREAVGVAAHRHGVKAPSWVRWLRPWQVSLLSRVAPLLVPLPIETYLAYHFSKVGEQTEQAVQGWIAGADDAGLPHRALDELGRRLQAARAS